MNRISDEMRRYIGNGCCPHCGRALLNTAYSMINSNIGLSAYVIGLNLIERMRLAPSSAPVVYRPPNTFECLRCGGTWYIRIVDPPGILRGGVAGALMPDVRGVGPALPRALTPDQFRFSNAEPTGRVEIVLRDDPRVLPNNSSAKVTDTEEFACEVTRSVVVEDRNANISGTQARLNLAGFAVLGRTLGDELRHMYAVTYQATLRSTRTLSIEVPPHSVVELAATWMLVREHGVGHFPAAGGLCADIPYEVDMELRLTWTIRNVQGGGHGPAVY